MSRATEIREQLEYESQRRTRLAVPAFAGGFLYLLSSIIITETLNGAPTVGVFQGLAPTLEGVRAPSVSPRTNEVKFVSHHAFPLIAGSLLAAIAVTALVLIMKLLLEATVFRRPQTWGPTRMVLLVGGGGFAVMAVVHQVVSAIETHSFATGHNFSTHAVNHALTSGTANVVVAVLGQVAGLAFAVGIIITTLNALRVGLLARWLGMLGMFAGLLIFLPLGGAQLQVVPALFMVMMGVLYAKKWPGKPPLGGEPPAWSDGEARPWPSGAQLRAERAAERGGAPPGKRGRELPPEPAKPVVKSTSRKRRKRGASG